MNENLQRITRDFVDIMKETDGVLGAWNFGSVLHGMSDEYSDVDIVFLVEGNHFQKTEGKLSGILSKVCDEIILCREEGFNSNAIINNGYLLKKDHEIVPFDVFLLNKDFIDDFICKIHYTGLSEKDIIFDTDNHVKGLCADAPRGNVWNDNIERLITTWLYHFHMTAKYLMRQDYFKLNQVMRTLYDAHASLLLTGYDVITWGGAENKLHFLPADRQEHLKKYFCTEDFSLNKNHLSESMGWFEEDMRDVLKKKNQKYRMENIMAVKEYWNACTRSIDNTGGNNSGLQKERFPYLFSMAQEEHSAIVLCNLEHEIIYMNPAATERYAKSGGEALLGKSLLDCHNDKSCELIERVLAWFRKSKENNRVYTFYNKKENKDVYMVALRDFQGELIGYYEKHEYRDRETRKLYDIRI